MISNLIFDMGGVLIRWNPEKMLENAHLSVEEMAILNRELFHGVEWIQMDRGTLSAIWFRVPVAPCIFTAEPK